VDGVVDSTKHMLGFTILWRLVGLHRRSRTPRLARKVDIAWLINFVPLSA
jgi:hypothetical protein